MAASIGSVPCVEGVLKSMLLTKPKRSLALLLVAALCGAGLTAEPEPKKATEQAATLLKKLRDLRPQAGEDEWANVLRDLIQLGPDAVPVLIKALDDTDD